MDRPTAIARSAGRACPVTCQSSFSLPWFTSRFSIGQRVKAYQSNVNRSNCITENLNETESLHHRENLNQIGSRNGDPKDEANDEREAIGDCSDAGKISESKQKAEAPDPG